MVVVEGGKWWLAVPWLFRGRFALGFALLCLLWGLEPPVSLAAFGSLDTGSMRAKVDSDAQQGRLVGVVATPMFFINGIPLSGAQPAAAFEKIIEDELARKARQNTALR